MKKNRRRWTPEDDARLAKLYPLHSNPVIGRMLGRSEPAVLMRAHKLGIYKPPGFINSGWWAPDSAAWNKGKPFDAGGRSSKTRFKKGQNPHNWHPIGHERITDEGYRQIKMADSGCTQRDYINIHWLVWCFAGGTLPDGYTLAFRDGDKSNVDLENLELVSRTDLMRRNSYHRYGKEIALAVQLKGAITRQINKRTKREQHQQPA